MHLSAAVFSPGLKLLGSGLEVGGETCAWLQPWEGGVGVQRVSFPRGCLWVGGNVSASDRWTDGEGSHTFTGLVGEARD